jgi:uncharacterized repeat protein (TIGR01451 family)
MAGFLLLALAGVISAQEPLADGDELHLPTPVPVPPVVAPLPDLPSPCPKDPPVPQVAIRVRVPVCAAVGEELEYRIVVENTSEAAAHHVLVRNPLPANALVVKVDPEPATRKPELRWSLGTMQPGDRKTLILMLKPTATGELRNCARVQFEHGQCVCTRIGVGETRSRPDLPQAPADLPKVEDLPKAGTARLVLAKTGPRQRYANLATTYLLTVSNPGSAAAHNVMIADPVPAGATFVRADNGQLADGVVRWAIGTLEPGASRTVQVVLKAKAPGEVRNQATASADGGLSAKAEAVTNFSGISALAVEVSDTEDPVEVGADTSYVIAITNQGSTPVTNIQIKALVPPEMAVTQLKGPINGQLGEKTVQGQAVVFDALKTLAPAATVKIEILVKAKQAGDARFKVVITADQLKAGGPVHQEESTAIFTEALPMGARAFRSPRYLCSKQAP